MKIVILLLFFCQVSLAQTLGNPGGGGPDGEDNQKKCIRHQKEINQLVSKFLAFWEREMILNNNRIETFNFIEIELMTAFLFHFDPLILINCSECNINYKYTPFTRKHYIEELTLLNEMIQELNINLELEGCGSFNQDERRQFLKKLKAIKKYYEKH